MTTSYSQADVVRLTGASANNVKWWTHRGVLHADIEESPGTGHHRQFSFVNLVEAAVAAELNRYNLPLDGMRGALAIVRFLISHGRVDSSVVSLAQLREHLTARLAASPRLQAEASKVLGTTPAETVGNMLMWRFIADPARRKELAFGGIVFSEETRRYGFFAQPKSETPWVPFEKLGRSMLFVNILQIITDLEAATGASLE
jgi:hypothetical protein